ncbi:uncharacterized protein LOC119677304 [Teleopsis dalmanni]|uniref:uncharacterized protein LOC119677304 n=1 Tax=Teleopsis dalmanni TaxID=139649 RepID=UPI000D32C9F7|nr:uncharacterized protein LOC119677304 [Teleopsis dalmanni]
MEWKQSTGAGLTADMGERSVTEHVLKKCPKFDLLYDIFGRRSNVNVNIVESDAPVECLINPPQVEVEAIAMPTNVRNETDSDSAVEDSPISSTSSRMRGMNRKRSSYAQRDSTSYIIALQQRRIEIEEQKLKIMKENADLDRAQALQMKKMELEAHKELELEKLKLELELKKYEIDLKYKNQ